MKSGYTTGSCFVAGIIAGMQGLLNNKILEEVEIQTLNNKIIDIPVSRIKIRNKSVTTSIIKYSGDDPDVTNGIEIFVRVKLVDEFKNTLKGYLRKNFYIRGGRGVGIITKKGLQQPIGKYAINPGPIELILKNIEVNFKDRDLKDKKFELMIYIPKGQEVAKKTFNEKLGIIGGISVLGTTGILNPMSEQALKDSLKLELNVLKENNPYDWVIFSFGNLSKKYAKEMGLDENNLIIIGNYIGFMLDEAKKLDYKKIFLIGHMGKAVKIAGGIYNTHSKIADARIEIMVSNAFEVGESRETILKLLKSNTTDEACTYIENRDYFNYLANKVSKKSCEYLKDKEIRCEALIFSFGNHLGISSGFKSLISECDK